ISGDQITIHPSGFVTDPSSPSAATTHTHDGPGTPPRAGAGSSSSSSGIELIGSGCKLLRASAGLDS
ncbi:hypothetical protein KEM52_001364, partial [Ascosphaera acerosa]